jgi:photosystem I reaction center subunit XII
MNLSDAQVLTAIVIALIPAVLAALLGSTLSNS